MLEIPNTVHGIGNAIEALFWWLLAAIMLFVALKWTVGRLDCVAVAIVFLCFGASDVVEISTGAWWRPWWLLIWKGLCVISLVLLLYRNRELLKRSNRE
jgi:hypothetical protein